MDKKLSFIKERILYLTELKGFGKEEFFTKIGMTYGNFKGKLKEKPLNSNALENIVAIIPDVNTDWLLTGNGEPLKTEKAYPVDQELQTQVNEALTSYITENGLEKTIADNVITQLQPLLDKLNVLEENQQQILDKLNK